VPAFEEGWPVDKWQMNRFGAAILVVGLTGALSAWAQTPAPVAQTDASGAPPAAAPAPYQPKFDHDPARSESEAQALGYMRVVLRAQREYKKRHN
jgi:hypothetical protein